PRRVVDSADRRAGAELVLDANWHSSGFSRREPGACPFMCIKGIDRVKRASVAGSAVARTRLLASCLPLSRSAGHRVGGPQLERGTCASGSDSLLLPAVTAVRGEGRTYRAAPWVSTRWEGDARHD